MKTVILAGGLGTRLSEDTALRPKPMVEIDGKPILWHVINIYAVQGVNSSLRNGDWKLDPAWGRDWIPSSRAAKQVFEGLSVTSWEGNLWI